ncbi:hypothetical protein H7I76_26775 [Mycolicibacterium vaccae]|nr:hypothetical protein [Mycolicibacterium vaccae]
MTEGIRVPAGQVYVAVESPRGELGVHMVSDGGRVPTGCTTGTRRSPISEAVAAMCDGRHGRDAIAAVASIAR